MANAHIIISNLVPYSKDTLNNSLLAADSGDFPYKLRLNTYEIIKENYIAISESYTLSFIGSATYSGGLY